MDVLRRQAIQMIATRARSTYHKPGKSRYIPRSIRKWFYQNPKSPLYGLLIVLTGTILWPYVHFVHARMILDTEDYVEYRKRYNYIVMQRARHGDSLYIPFYSTDEAAASFNFYRQKTEARRANKQLPDENPSSLTDTQLESLPNVTVKDFWDRWWNKKSS